MAICPHYYTALFILQKDSTINSCFWQFYFQKNPKVSRMGASSIGAAKELLESVLPRRRRERIFLRKERKSKHTNWTV